MLIVRSLSRGAGAVKDAWLVELAWIAAAVMSSFAPRARERGFDPAGVAAARS